MVELPILWQRLVKNGNTCPRCGDTQREVEQALGILSDVLRPLDIEPRLREVAIDEETFNADPIASNHIWIAGRSVEDWLDGETGGSQCSSVCGESKCRTVSLNGVTFETIPQRLVIRAALLAVADLMAAGHTDVGGARAADPDAYARLRTVSGAPSCGTTTSAASAGVTSG